MFHDSKIHCSEFYAPELDPTERAIVLQEHNQLSIDAGFMRLAHAVCDSPLVEDNSPDTEDSLLSKDQWEYLRSYRDGELFSDIPSIVRPRFNRSK